MSVNYAEDVLINVSDDGMNGDLWEQAYNDNKVLSKIDAKSDRERNLYFYLDMFYEDLCDEFGFSDLKDSNEIVVSAFKKLRDLDEIDLTDIRRAIYKSIKEKIRLAYPNTSGYEKSNAKEVRDIDKWVKTLGAIYSAARAGENVENISKSLMEGWSMTEKLDFKAWARYYDKGDYEKYNIKTAAEIAVPNMPEGLELPQDEPDATSFRRGPGRPRKTKKTPEYTKQSIIRQLDSARKNLRDFVNVWPHNVWQNIDELLAHLQREIIPLKTTATITDCIIRTANVFENKGFFEGADALRKVAQPPAGGGDDVATQIEKALTGKEYDIKGKGPAAPGAEVGMPPLGEDMGMPSGEVGMEAPSSPLAEEIGAPLVGVEEELPPPEAPPEAPPEELATGENPFSGKTTQDVLSILEPLSKKLSEREFVRALSKADMMLDSMNIASHFPELGEAQAKALELNLYVGTRIEKIINKLKGGVDKEEGEKKEKAPEIDMGEFASGPKEREAIEVTEGAPPPASATSGKMEPAGV